MDGALRQKLRRQLDKHARKRVDVRHVEFCSECGKACENRGRRISTLCRECGRARKEGES